MLRPTTKRAPGAPYPLREKWVRDVVACYLARDSPITNTGYNFKHTHFSRIGYVKKRETLASDLLL